MLFTVNSKNLVSQVSRTVDRNYNVVEHVYCVVGTMPSRRAAKRWIKMNFPTAVVEFVDAGTDMEYNAYLNQAASDLGAI